MDKTPCTCRGENDRCFKCFGSGMYSKEVLAPPSMPSKGRAIGAKRGRVTSKKTARKSRTKDVSTGKRLQANGFSCGICGVVAPTALVLEAHRKAVHARNSAFKPSSTQVVQKHSQAGTKIEPIRDVLDATRGWGVAFRDHGQFGSPVAHDPMDDESTS